MDFTQRWLIMFAIATILFAIALLILRINIRSLLIFFALGISAVTLWMVVDARFFAHQGKKGEEAMQRVRHAPVLYVIMTSKKCAFRTDVRVV